jgi:hypothetical protein
MNFLREHIKRFLEKGVIEPSSSYYSNPMLLVRERDHSFLAIVDYRHLNQRIELESEPWLDIHSAFHWFCKTNCFITLDLNQACYQIPLSEESKPLTAFLYRL